MFWARILSISKQRGAGLDTIASWTEHSSSMLFRLRRRSIPVSIRKVGHLCWTKKIKQRATDYDGVELAVESLMKIEWGYGIDGIPVHFRTDS
jgi:hypothetical protein